MFDSFQHFRDEPRYNKLVGEGYLIVEFKCPIEEEQFKSWSERHYITYVLSGKKKWITADNQWTLHEGESVFVHKGAYINQQYFEEDFCVLMFFLTDQFIRSFVRTDMIGVTLKNSGSPVKQPVYRIRASDSLSTLYQSVFDYLNRVPNVPKRLVEIKFRELLLNIMSDPANQELHHFIINIARSNESSLTGIMEDNYLFNLSVEEFARLCGRSLSSFKRDFQHQYEMSPRKWLIKKRLEYAHTLLLNTRKSVQEIGFESGFENASHFNKKFKEAFGLTPLACRRATPFSSQNIEKEDRGAPAHTLIKSKV